MAFLHQYDPASPAYLVAKAYRLSGSLDIPALEKVLAEIIRRHGSLRTIIRRVGTGFIQQVLPPTAFTLPIEDLRSIPEETQSAQIQSAFAALQTPFDLSSQPGVHLRLLRLRNEEHLLLVVIDHIYTDGGSMLLFLDELQTLYAAFAAGLPSPLPELPVQYADFAAWQQARQESEKIHLQLEGWLKRLPDAHDLITLDLPVDHPRPPKQTFRGQTISLEISKEQTNRLRSLAGTEQSTLFMLLLAAYQLLLHRYTAQDGFLVGIPFAGRNLVETEKLIGLFINSLPVAANCAGNPPFISFLQRTRQACLEAYAGQEVPFEQLVEAIAPPRNPAHPPLFQTMFQVRRAAPKKAGSGVLEIHEEHTLQPEIAEFDLVGDILDYDDHLVCNFRYNCDLFERETMERLGSHWLNLLQAIVDHSEARLGDLPLLGEAEKTRLLTEWNHTATVYPRQRCLIDLFSEQVEAAGGSIAVEDGDRRLTYRQLDEQSSRLAGWLQAQGVQPGQVVAVCLERRTEQAVGVLAALKCGGVYLPLDLAYPAERLSFLLENSQASALITEKKHLQKFSTVGLPQIYLDENPEVLTAHPQGKTHLVAASNPAYIMYTSGSTGAPKGVVIPQRAVARLVLNTNYVQIRPQDRLAQASNFAFDAYSFELWGAILNGACQVILPQEVLFSPTAFRRFLNERGVTIVFLTTSLFNLLVAEDPGMFQGLRCLYFGGEVADPDAVQRVLASAPPQHFFNIYGPTENTTFTTYYEIDPVHFSSQGSRGIPVGKPVANTTCHILDMYGNLCPLGVAGELVTGGDGLALGYHNQPGLTADQFIADPFHSGGRLYRTGDKARCLPDGNIEFLGRFDQQVKIRGFRVEPGETESVLRAHPAVRECLALVRQEANGEKRLVAYATLEKDRSETASSLLDHLRLRLPPYQVPAGLVILKSFPLNPNGKIDRSLLPPPGSLPAQEDQAPRTPLETQLAEIWQQILELPAVGIRENFFDLGGSSLKAIHLLAAVEEKTSVRLPVLSIFQHPTIAAQATVVARTVPNSGQAVLLRPGRSDLPPMFWIGYVISHRLISNAMDTGQVVYGLQFRYTDRSVDLSRPIPEIAAELIQNMRRVQHSGPYYLGGWSLGGHAAYEMACQLVEAGESVNFVGLLDASANRLPGFRKAIHPWQVGIHYLDWAKNILWFHLRNLAGLGWKERFHYIIFRVGKRLPQTPPSSPSSPSSSGEDSASLSSSQPESLLRGGARIRASQVYKSFIPRHYAGRVSLFRSIEMHLALPDRTYLGWNRLAAKVDVVEIPGDHASLVEEPFASVVGRKVSEAIRKTLG